MNVSINTLDLIQNYYVTVIKSIPKITDAFTITTVNYLEFNILLKFSL